MRMGAKAAARTSTVSAQASLIVGGPSVGSRAAYDLARLLLRGDENGWPSPLAADAITSLSQMALELLARAAADGHDRARAMLPHVWDVVPVPQPA